MVAEQALFESGKERHHLEHGIEEEDGQGSNGRRGRFHVQTGEHESHCRNHVHDDGQEEQSFAITPESFRSLKGREKQEMPGVLSVDDGQFAESATQCRCQDQAGEADEEDQRKCVAGGGQPFEAPDPQSRDWPGQNHPQCAVFDFFGHYVAGNQRQIQSAQQEEGEGDRQQGEGESVEIIGKKGVQLGRPALKRFLKGAARQWVPTKQQENKFRSQRAGKSQIGAFPREQLEKFIFPLEEEQGHE